MHLFPRLTPMFIILYIVPLDGRVRASSKLSEGDDVYDVARLRLGE